MRQPTITETLRKAWPIHKDDAERAFDLFYSWCDKGRVGRVPGMGTAERLAVRLYLGKTIEEAAAREYLYRWSLAIKAPDQCMLPHNSTRNPVVSAFGTPHPLGM
jgi:hypothetical protein